MPKVKIGADELILWLRKNGKATTIPNDEVQGLGRKIYELIVNKLNGKKIEDNRPSYWTMGLDDKNIRKFGLPKTAAQYEIDSCHLETLFLELNTW